MISSGGNDDVVLLLVNGSGVDVLEGEGERTGSRRIGGTFHGENGGVRSEVDGRRRLEWCGITSSDVQVELLVVDGFVQL